MTVTAIRSLLLALGVIMLVLAAARDLHSRIVPNGLAISIAATGLLIGVLTRPLSLWINLVVALLVVATLAGLAHVDAVGGGDIKLLAASTLLVSPSGIAGLIIAVALAGGVLSLLYLALGFVLRRKPRRATRHRSHAMARWWHEERARIRAGRTVPYGVAISSGCASYIIAEWFRCLSATSCSL